MKPATKHILIALAIGAGIYVIVEIYKAWKAGVTAISSLLMAPFTAISAAWSSASSAASSAVATVQNISAGNQAAATLETMNNSAYAPGGSEYLQIEASQGQAAADAAWATVQAQQQVQDSQAVTADPLSWVNLL